MFSNYVELYKYREMLRMWIVREIRVRYKQSMLGAAWAILQPLSMMIVFTIVFSHLTQIPTEGVPYPVFSYTALLPWTFFSTSVSFGVPSLVNNLNLVTKTYFPREILPIGSIGAAFFDFIIASTIYIILIFIYEIPITWTWSWVPLLLIIQILLTLGITFFGSALIVRYRDVRFIVPLGLQLWMYATPIIYPVDLVPEAFRTFYMLNPMAGLIESYRNVILHGQPPVPAHLFISATGSILLFFIGYGVFKSLEPSFADII